MSITYHEHVTFALQHARWLLADRTLRPRERAQVIATLAADIREAAIEHDVAAVISELESGGHIEAFTDEAGETRYRLADAP